MKPQDIEVGATYERSGVSRSVMGGEKGWTRRRTVTDIFAAFPGGEGVEYQTDYGMTQADTLEAFARWAHRRTREPKP